MEGWLSFLLFAAFFYLMMRFGCGAHIHGGHGGHGRHGAGHEAGGPAQDPVCGMGVQAGQGYSKMHEGREYRFCSRSCLDKFDAEPQRYLSQKGARQ